MASLIHDVNDQNEHNDPFIQVEALTYYDEEG